MKIGLHYDVAAPGSVYRAIDPGNALARRGHTIVWPPDPQAGRNQLGRLAPCDVVLIYRSCDEDSRKLVKGLKANGVPVIYDNDDQLAAVPRDSQLHRPLGGLRGQAALSHSLRMAQEADVTTAPSAALADVYERGGAGRVEVIPNMVAPERVVAPRRHGGLIVGWVAGLEHEIDARDLGLSAQLQELLDRHEDVHVEAIGVDLRLRGRYRHRSVCQFEALPRVMAGWDVGLAPLADHPFNHGRSDIKVKEYAAVGVAWLASPVGPYAGLGADQGGELVADSCWADAAGRLVQSTWRRRKLARRGRRWARGQTSDVSAAMWERVFASTRANAA